jgi:tetratricopeptide (TPR) repeat protein
VTLAYEDQLSCEQNETLKQNAAYFQARLENTRAFRVYKEGRFAAAAQGFLRAMQLDPKYGKARTNYIAALARAGDIAAAKSAYAAAFRVDPVSTYEKLLTDDDFGKLRADLRTKSRVEPVLRLIDEQLGSYAGYSKEHGLLCAVRIEHSWGAENWTAELHLFDARTRALQSQHTLVRWHDITPEGKVKTSQRKELEARLSHFNEALSALGFRALSEGMHGNFNQLAPAAGAVQVELPALGRKIVAENDVLSILRENQVLATFRSSLKDARPSQVYGVPEMNSLIYFGAYEVAEGCDSGPETRLEVFTTDQLGSK